MQVCEEVAQYIYNPFDVDIFVASNYEAVLAESEGLISTPNKYFREAQEAEDAGDLALSHIFKIIGCICSLALAPDNRNAPFSPAWRLEGNRAFLPEDLSSEAVLLLEGIFEHIRPAWLKARVADVLWLVKTEDKIQYAHFALENYQLLPIESGSWRRRQFGRCWKRAYSLSLQIGARESTRDIKARLRAQMNGDSWLMHEIAGVLSVGRLEEVEQIELGEILLRRVKDLSKYDATLRNGFLNRFWERLRHLFLDKPQIVGGQELQIAITLAKDANEMFSAPSNVARKVEAQAILSWLHEKEGDGRADGDLGSQLGALYCYQDALQAIRAIPAQYRSVFEVDATVSRLRRKIRKAGLHAESQLPTVQVPTGVTPEIVRESEVHILGTRSVEEAVFRYSALYNGPKRQDWIRMPGEPDSGFGLDGLFGATHLDEGRVVAQQDALGLGVENLNEERSDADARFDFLRTCVSFIVRGMLWPGHSALLSEHTVPLNMMIEIAHRSPLVAANRVYLVGYGLHRGFEFDFPSAVHILAPQLEKIVRDMVRNRGGVVSTIDQTTNVEHYIALGSLLDKPEALEALGEDVLFEIRSLFTDQRGPNLRNDVAHGEMTDVTSQGDFCTYAWWLILRILCKSVLDGPNG